MTERLKHVALYSSSLIVYEQEGRKEKIKYQLTCQCLKDRREEKRIGRGMAQDANVSDDFHFVV